MIYTVTLNPSLDYIVSVQDFTTGTINRTKQEKILPGGKGINVSIVLGNLGVENTALGFTAGFTGAEIKRRLADFSMKTDFVTATRGMSRINVKLRSDISNPQKDRKQIPQTSQETEINGMGPEITEEELQQFYEKLNGLGCGDFLVLAGNIPSSLPQTMYLSILEHLEQRQEKKLEVIVDAAGQSLLNTLNFHPFLIKPNKQELQELFAEEWKREHPEEGELSLNTKEDICLYARKLQELGARNVLVSLAGEGAILLTESGEALHVQAPKGQLVNSVGAGDSMVAGFMAGYLKTGDYREALLTGISAGSASAFSENLATREEVEQVRTGMKKADVV